MSNSSLLQSSTEAAGSTLGRERATGEATLFLTFRALPAVVGLGGLGAEGCFLLDRVLTIAGMSEPAFFRQNEFHSGFPVHFLRGIPVEIDPKSDSVEVRCARRSKKIG